MDTLEAMKKAKENEDQGMAFYTDDPGARVQYMRPYPGGQGWQFQYETGAGPFIPDVAPDWQPVWEKPTLGDWYKKDNGGEYFQVAEIFEDRKSIKAYFPKEYFYVNLDWTGTKYPEKVTDEKELAFLNAGRLPGDWQPMDIYRQKDKLLIYFVVNPKEVPEDAVPVCFTDQRLDLPKESEPTEGTEVAWHNPETQETKKVEVFAPNISEDMKRIQEDFAVAREYETHPTKAGLYTFVLSPFTVYAVYDPSNKLIATENLHKQVNPLHGYPRREVLLTERGRLRMQEGIVPKHLTNLHNEDVLSVHVTKELKGIYEGVNEDE